MVAIFIHFFPLLLTWCFQIAWWMTAKTLTANMEEAERREESVEDMTAADTAPRPMNDTATGVMWK